MQDNLESNQEITNVDLTKIAALQQKRTLAFVNHFTTTTVQFLNNFMKICEQKLMDFERKLEKVEAAMVLLETRLASIPEVNTPNVTEESQSNNTVTEQDTTDNNTKTTDSNAETTDPNTETTDPNTENTKTKELNEDINTNTNVKESAPREYERFIKMVQVGVPLQAVKLKVSVEGLDPNILEKFVSK